jgi:small subunit ribosomal protein S8
MTDPISDMIIRLKNAGESHKETVTLPFSKLKFEICTVLEKEGFIGEVSKKGKKVTKSIEVALIYNGRTPRIEGVKRVSKPSRRIYKKAHEMRPVKSGHGAMIVSTPKGIVSGLYARKNKIGGEALFEIW